MKQFSFAPHWRCLPIFVSSLLVGCAVGTAPLSDALSALAAQAFDASNTSIVGAKLNPAYRYLRVDVPGRASALLVLGYIDKHPLGEIEVWYSATGEVIKIQNGRIVGSSGLEHDWRIVRYAPAPPPWSAVPAQGISYERQHDEMPGYRYAISETVTLQPWTGLPPAAAQMPSANATAAGAAWFREEAHSSSGASLPPAWFAWGVQQGQPAVVYSKQCLTNTFCLQLQPWPPTESAP